MYDNIVMSDAVNDFRSQSAFHGGGGPQHFATDDQNYSSHSSYLPQRCFENPMSSCNSGGMYAPRAANSYIPCGGFNGTGKGKVPYSRLNNYAGGMNVNPLFNNAQRNDIT